MARKLVEFDDVAAAAQKLKDAGKRPTVIAIRDIIGKGSFTTISTYLKQWSEEHSLDEELVEVVLPESVMSDAELFLQKIYTVAKASADEQLERERELLRQKEIEYQKICSKPWTWQMMPPNGLSYWRNNLKLSPTKIRARCGPW